MAEFTICEELKQQMTFRVELLLGKASKAQSFNPYGFVQQQEISASSEPLATNDNDYSRYALDQWAKEGVKEATVRLDNDYIKSITARARE